MERHNHVAMSCIRSRAASALPCNADARSAGHAKRVSVSTQRTTVRVMIRLRILARRAALAAGPAPPAPLRRRRAAPGSARARAVLRRRSLGRARGAAQRRRGAAARRTRQTRRPATAACPPARPPRRRRARAATPAQTAGARGASAQEGSMETRVDACLCSLRQQRVRAQLGASPRLRRLCGAVQRHVAQAQAALRRHCSESVLGAETAALKPRPGSRALERQRGSEGAARGGPRGGARGGGGHARRRCSAQLKRRRQRRQRSGGRERRSRRRSVVHGAPREQAGRAAEAARFRRGRPRRGPPACGAAHLGTPS